MARKPESLGKRAKRLAEFRHLTDSEAAALLDDATTRTISAPVELVPPGFDVPLLTSSE